MWRRAAQVPWIIPTIYRLGSDFASRSHRAAWVLSLIELFVRQQWRVPAIGLQHELKPCQSIQYTQYLLSPCVSVSRLARMLAGRQRQAGLTSLHHRLLWADWDTTYGCMSHCIDQRHRAASVSVFGKQADLFLCQYFGKRNCNV